MSNRPLPTQEQRIEQLEAALRAIELEVYGRPEPFCRNVAAKVIEVLGTPEATGNA